MRRRRGPARSPRPAPTSNVLALPLPARPRHSPHGDGRAPCGMFDPTCEVCADYFAAARTSTSERAR